MNLLSNIFAKKPEDMSVSDGIEEVRKLLSQATDGRQKAIFGHNPFGKQTMLLWQYTDDCRRRAHAPKHAFQAILRGLADDKGFFFLEPVGVFAHISQIPAIIKALRAFSDTAAAREISVLKEKEDLNEHGDVELPAAEPSHA